MTLTEQQVEEVLQESLHRGYWELDTDGNQPRDFKDREAAAKELIRQTQLSYLAGNRTEGVVALLHIAEDELISAQPNSDTGGSMATATAEVDLSSHGLDALVKFEETLLNYDQSNEEVQENLALVRAEIARKGGSPKGAETNGSIVGSPPSVVAGVEQVSPESDAAQDASIRKDLLDRLTFPAMRAHSIDPSMIDGLSDSELQWIVEHPGGAGESQPAQAAAPAPVPTPEPEPQGETIETTRMVVTQPEPVVEAVQDRAEKVESQNPVDSEREELEGQVTGPILKSYGRGRVDVPGIGINELRFMIENPDGRVTQEQLLAARALDEDSGNAPISQTTEEVNSPEPAQEEVGSSPEMVVTNEVLGPEQTDSFLPQSLQPAKVEPEVAPQRLTKAQAFGKEPPANPAQEIIDRENLPIPPEIEGRPPRLPFDMSKCSDEDVMSYHGQFHSCHSRANYLVGLWEGDLRDVARGRKAKEVQVANNLPSKDPDDSRKRLTDAQREAMVAADPEVIELKEREHNIERELRQLKALRDNYSADVSATSRQWTMRHREADGAGGLR